MPRPSPAPDLPSRRRRRVWLLVALGLACGRPRPDAPPPGAAPAGAAPLGSELEPHVAPAPADSPREPAGPSSAELHGELVTRGGHRILRVWGTPTQMGHAHGALLRAAILEVIDGYALEVIPPATLEAIAPVYATAAQVPPRLVQEAEGIVAGMKAAGGARSAELGRELRASDLLVLNAMTDLLAIGCSSVSAWGPSTGADPGLSGAPAIVRNLDWSEDPDLLRHQVIIAYRPDDPARQPVVSVAFAGYIGCLSCLNEAGVAALFNMGYGEGAASLGGAMTGFAPANLLLRDALERRDVDGDGRSTADDLEAQWRAATHAGSYILHLIEPRRAGVSAPARVLEVEADGVVTRAPGGDAALGEQILAATNHLREKTAPAACSRYDRLRRVAARRGQRFDREALWTLGTELRLPQVVHTVLVEPESRRLSAWLREPDGPTRGDRVPPGLGWDELLGEGPKNSTPRRP